VPQASLDLHGMTLAAAERAVSRFLDQATAQDLRIVLIVTGKGVRLDGGRLLGGRIRAEFLGWLNRADNRARVRGVRAAHPRHGGSGAFYVLLLRRSSASNRSLRATPQR
jgi:DNA-nicking Smr family endonuclease